MKTVFLWLLSAGLAAAKPATFSHRITGLFAPDREADLRTAMEGIPTIKLVSFDFDRAVGVFEYDPAVAFKGYRPEKYVERFDQLLVEASGRNFGVRPLAVTPPEQLTRVEIPVAGLDCRACSYAAYEIVAAVPGVTQATASFKEGRITALIEPALTNQAALETILGQRRVKVVKTPPPDGK